MLSKEKITKNFKKFISTGEKYGFITDEFVGAYGQKLITAHSTSDKHYDYEGGLIHQALNLTKVAVEINKGLPEEKQFDLGLLIKLCCLWNIEDIRVDEECCSNTPNVKRILTIIESGILITGIEYLILNETPVNDSGINDLIIAAQKLEKIKR